MLLLTLMTLIPFLYGVISGFTLIAALYGSLVSISTTLAFWGYGCFRTMRLRRDYLAALLKEEVRLRGEAEERYKDADELYRDAATERQDMKDQRDRESEMNRRLLDEVSQLSGEVAAGKTKDALVEALQRRVTNINAEYNGRVNRGGTTLADVKKLTGEN